MDHLTREYLKSPFLILRNVLNPKSLRSPVLKVQVRGLQIKNNFSKVPAEIHWLVEYYLSSLMFIKSSSPRKENFFSKRPASRVLAVAKKICFPEVKTKFLK